MPANDLEFFPPKKKFVKRGRNSTDDEILSGAEETDISEIFATDRCSVEFKVVDFKLPFDIWWKYRSQPSLKYRDPSNQYKKIRASKNFVNFSKFFIRLGLIWGGRRKNPPYVVPFITSFD